MGIMTRFSLVLALILAFFAACDSGVTDVDRVESIAVSPATPSVEMGGTVQLQARALGAGGDPMSGSGIFWTSEDTTKAKVSSTGLVTGVAVGSVRVAASLRGTNEFVTVTITPPRVASVSVSPPQATVARGGTVQLSATTADRVGNALAGREVAWTSADPAIATVDPSGVVTGVARGSTAITATSEGIAGEATVTVTGGDPARPGTVSGGAQNGVAGGPLPDSLSVQILDENGAPVVGASVR